MADPNPLRTDGPIFIVGFPRSGTTLVRALVSAHHEAALLPYETHLVDRWLAVVGDDGLATTAGFDRFWAAFTQQPGFDRTGMDPGELRRQLEGAGPTTVRSVLDGLMRTYAVAQGKARRGEKTPDHYRHIGTLVEWFPDCRILFVVRDPRAVLASWLTLDRPWARVPSTEVVTGWCNSAREALRWSADPRVYPLEYEDLVTSPGAVLDEVFAFLELEPTSDLHRDGSGASHHGRYDPRGPVRSEGLDRWRRVLLPTELTFVESRARSEMIEFGYEPVVRVAASDRARARAARIGGRAARGSREVKRRASTVLRRTR
jgi:hypothetical protein